jgi:hypothetical protein
MPYAPSIVPPNQPKVAVKLTEYEGESDPGDEATVYGLQSKKFGHKGILITGMGMTGAIDALLD